jgi:hypothetical protein
MKRTNGSVGITSDKCARLHHQVQKTSHYVGNISQELECSPQVSRWSPQSFTEASDLFKSRSVDEACVQAQYLEMDKNIG